MDKIAESLTWPEPLHIQKSSASVQICLWKIQDMSGIISTFMAERVQLQEELKYTRSACTELHSQNEYLQRLLREAQEALPPREGPNHFQTSPGTTWVGGTWLSPSPSIPSLVPIQKAWLSGKTQSALALLTETIVLKDFVPNERIEAGLLLSTIMRSSGDLARALTHAEISLSIARKEELQDLEGKAQFHRGLCYFYQDRYADARWCFTLASHTRGHQDLVEINMRMAEEKIQQLPFGHPDTVLNITQ